jgi:hypothetical protein
MPLFLFLLPLPPHSAVTCLIGTDCWNMILVPVHSPVVRSGVHEAYFCVILVKHRGNFIGNILRLSFFHLNFSLICCLNLLFPRGTISVNISLSVVMDETIKRVKSLWDSIQLRVLNVSDAL